jgi:uncharacterized membrane protein
MPRSIAPAVATVAVAWLLLIVAAPSLSPPVGAMLYAVGALICHQLPDRSFHVDGVQLPVCARCFGLYAGGALGAVIVATMRRRGPSLQPRSRIRIATIAAAIPTIVTVVAEWGLHWPVSNMARAVAALPLGFAVALVVVSAVATLHYD